MEYNRTNLEAMDSAERHSVLRQLEDELTTRLRERPAWGDYWREVERIIADLRDAGHDLWSHDYDGAGCQLWGWDYMHPESAGFLQVQFEFGDRVRTFWRTENPQLGALSREASS